MLSQGFGDTGSMMSKRDDMKCYACNGSGYYDNTGSPKCGSCGGTGKREEKKASHGGPRQVVLFLADWYKPGSVMKARNVPLLEKPDAIWTLLHETDPNKPPKLPIVPRIRVNAFPEDYVHDWNWRRGELIFSSRVADGPVWILLEYQS